MRFFLIITITLSFFASVANAQEKRWIGVFAVKESPLVNLVIRESGGDPGVYYPELRRLLDAGQIEPAPGRYCFIPYQGGQPYEKSECFTTRTGVYTMWAPAEFVAPNRAMCVRVPRSWIAIAGQTRYPKRGGGQVNCRDFGPEATGDFAATRRTAAMIVVVEAAN